MKAEITNFMGCSYAEIDATPIALLVGKNHQGKSSTLRAIQCALTGETIPLGLKKADAGLMVKLGADGAKVTLYGDSVAIINWPKAELRTIGDNPPQSSPMAAGLISIIEMPDKQRIEFLRELLNCLPAKADLVDALKPQGIADAVIDKLWEQIDQDGWEATHKRAGDKGRDFKAQWNYVTKETYGSKKADIWLPDGWDDSLTGSSKDAMESQVALAKAELEQGIAQLAVGDEERARLAKEAEQLAAAKDAEEIAQNNLAKAKRRRENVQNELSTMPTIPGDLICPHCAEPIIIKGGKLEKAIKMSAADAEAAKQHMVALKKLDAETVTEIQAATLELEAAIASVKAAKDATDKLAECAGGNITQDELNLKRESVRKAEQRLKAFEDYTEASRLHRNVLNNQIILTALDENGVRRTAMERGLAAFNEKLAMVCKACGWGMVTVDRDLTITLNDRNYLLLSASEQYRVRVSLQLVVAEIDQSDAVIIDAMELLDRSGRAGLLRTLSKRRHASFIGMMANEPVVPNLKQMGCGNAYWIEAGNCTEIGEQ